jgi:hypothetical protein
MPGVCGWLIDAANVVSKARQRIVRQLVAAHELACRRPNGSAPFFRTPLRGPPATDDPMRADDEIFQRVACHATQSDEDDRIRFVVPFHA